MSATLTAILIAAATLPALLLVWLVAVHAKRQAEQNARELEEDKRLGLVSGHGPSAEETDRDPS